MAPYPIFLRALKTIIMPNFMLLTESEQLKHISALLLVYKINQILSKDFHFPERGKGYILDNTDFASSQKRANCTMQTKICNKVVSQFETRKEFGKSFIGNMADNANCSNKHLRTTCKQVLQQCCTEARFLCTRVKAKEFRPQQLRCYPSESGLYKGKGLSVV